jgi:hypothetical protein
MYLICIYAENNACRYLYCIYGLTHTMSVHFPKLNLRYTSLLREIGENLNSNIVQLIRSGWRDEPADASGLAYGKLASVLASVANGLALFLHSSCVGGVAHAGQRKLGGLPE